VKLFEDHVFKQNKNGDFQLAITNNKGKMFELVWKSEALFDRTGNAQFRRSTSTGKHLFWREKIYTSLNRYYKYFRGHLSFHVPEAVTYEGRPALKLVFSLNPQGKTPEEDMVTRYSLPGPFAVSILATDKILNKNRKRVSEYREAEGYIIVDKAAKVITAFKLHGVYVIPIAEDKKKKLQAKGVEPGDVVVFTMKADYEVKEIGQEQQIGLPQADQEMKRVKPAPPVKDLLEEMEKEPGEEKAEPATEEADTKTEPKGENK